MPARHRDDPLVGRGRGRRDRRTGRRASRSGAGDLDADRGRAVSLAVDVPVAVGGKSGKPRRVDGWLRRRLGVRITVSRGPSAGSDLLTAWRWRAPVPSVPRSRSPAVRSRRDPSGALRQGLMWESRRPRPRTIFKTVSRSLRALPVPEYRTLVRSRDVGRPLRRARRDAPAVLGSDGYDFRRRSTSSTRATRTGRALAASLVRRDARGGPRGAISRARALRVRRLARRGYVVLPADPFVRRVALREPARAAGHTPLFPQRSLESRLAPHAVIRPLARSTCRDKPNRWRPFSRRSRATSSTTSTRMMWWKHGRHLAGPELPTDGLHEIVVRSSQGVRTTPR
jgi:hypothetical protein